MAASSGSLHEDESKLSPHTIDRHRAIVSIMEELEAVDWYDQRMEGAGCPELKGLLAHNRDEEKEHAAMVLEWLRRRDPKLNEHLRTYLFTEGSLLDIEHEAEHGGGSNAGAPAGAPKGSKGSLAGAAGSLGIGSLKGEKSI